MVPSARVGSGVAREVVLPKQGKENIRGPRGKGRRLLKPLGNGHAD